MKAHTPVSSSWIASIAHDPASNVLEIRTKAGATFRLRGVTADHHAALLKADSVGAHFSKHIRGNPQFTLEKETV